MKRIANCRHYVSCLFLRLSSVSIHMTSFHGGRGRGWNQTGGQGLTQTSMRKRKLEDLPEMFKRQANIQHIGDGEAAEYSQRHWSGGRGGGQRGSSFQGSWFSHGLRQSQPNTSLWNTQETHGRRFYGNASYKRPWKEDEGNQREQTVSGGQGSGEDLQKNYRQRHETTRTGRTEYVNRRNDLFYLSRTMSRLLRHEALKAGLRMEADGFVFVSELLQCQALQGRRFTEEDVRKVTEDNDKQRFHLKVDPVSQKLMVRANQGHTIHIPDLELQPIRDASEAPIVVHGTFLNILPTIKQQGLSRMSRNHIHFAVGINSEDKEGGVISGFRRNCQVLIYINISKALKDGIQFFRSANNVILSPGDGKGFISPKYFDHIEYRFTGKKESKNEVDSTNSQEYQTEEAGPSKNKKQRREEKKTSQLDNKKKSLL